MVDLPNLSFTENTNSKAKNFFCGVVEGFYGRPWTTEQRKDLFQKMEMWGMDAYVYAPKDDYKHRAYWRDLYTVEEAEHLGSLIGAARALNLTFYYALSPGLDITYSNPKEVSTLKRKLDQVASLGCRAFALLFDDIDTEMSEADKERFTSFAHAQVTLTNDVVEHLGERAAGGFLVCPTQYCATRAVPSVSQSEYLRTLGTQLSQDVDVMWTGPKVITRIIDLEGVEEVAEVLKRKVVIWDNLHANDYDQKRLFLGPYSGRSPSLIPKLRGVLTNPNCEYGANFIAIHTLAQWSKCTSDHDTITLPSESSAVSADIRLEQQTSDVTDVEAAIGTDSTTGCDSFRVRYPTEPTSCNSTSSDLCYHPRTALHRAIAEWLPEFNRPKAAQGGGIGTAKPQPPQLQQIIPGIALPSTDIDSAIVAGVAAVLPADAVSDVPGMVPNVVPPGIGIIPSVNTCMGAPVAPLTTTTITCAIASSGSAPTVTVGSTAKSLVGATGILPIIATGNILAGDGTIPILPAPLSSITPIVGSIPTTILPVMNSLVSEHKVLPVLLPSAEILPTNNIVLPPPTLPISMNGGAPTATTAPIVTTTRTTDTVEPMECGGTTPAMSPTSSAIGSSAAEVQSQQTIGTDGSMVEEDVAMVPADNGDVVGMQVEQGEDGAVSETEINKSHGQESVGPLTTTDLELLCELFYLPFEHGARGIQLLQDFHWLKSHALQLEEEAIGSTTLSPDAEEWRKRAAKMEAQADSVARLMRRLTMCANRELLYDLYAYVWEMRLVIGLLVSYVKWLARGRFSSAMSSFTQGSYTWFSKGWKETFMSGEQEPWVFRGGLTSDLQRLIPVDSGNDLFVYKAPDVPTTCIYAVRPYIPSDHQPQPLPTEPEPKYKSDLEAIHSVCLHTCGDLEPFSKHLTESNMLCTIRHYGAKFPGDVIVGPYLHLHPELTLVIEDDKGMVGYACAALDYKQFQTKLVEPEGWLDEMKHKYPRRTEDELIDGISTNELADFVHKFCDPDCELGGIYTLQSTQYPACIVSAVLPRAWEDASVSKRLLTCLMAALRANGVFGCHAVVRTGDTKKFLHYYRLGFQKLTTEDLPGRSIMVRTF